jgi:phage terminase large subunit-like protein
MSLFESLLAPDAVQAPTRQRMVVQALDFATRSYVPAEGEERIDPLARLFDPSFTETTWYYEGSKVGDLPGKLHPKQLEALNNPAQHRHLFWGNQVGKTSVGAIDVALSALGRHPLQKAGLLRMPPFTAWASALTWELWEKILLPELLSWLPPWRVLDAPPAFRQSTRRDIIILADNGQESRITGKAAQQGSDAYQSARLDMAWLDEEHPESVWDELQPRMLRRGGRTLSTMTPLKGMTWVFGRIYEPVKAGLIPLSRHWYSHAGIRDNPSITPEAREEMLAELAHNPAQLAARDEGKFVRPLGAVLPWDPEKHFVDVTADMRASWKARSVTWFGAIDLGKWRFTFQFGPTNHEGVFTLVEEYFSQNEDADVRAKGIHTALKLWEVPDSVVIPADCADPTGIDDINAGLERLDSPYRIHAIDGKLKSKTAGINRLENMLNRGAFKVRRGLGADRVWRLGMNASAPGKPVMGSRWLWEIANWQYPKTPEGKIQKDEPDDATADGADFMDGARYLVMEAYGPEEPKQRPKAPTLQERIRRELQALDTDTTVVKKHYGVLRQ